MKVEWHHKVLGREPGVVEELDAKKEPRLTAWLASGLVTEHKSEPKTKSAKPTPAKEGRE